MTDPGKCQTCRFWRRESVVYGDCRVAPKPVQTLGSYGCREWEAKKGASDD